ncbi:hypothetical protein BDW75DRAFT_241077 [Aspergillus navahoensis]
MAPQISQLIVASDASKFLDGDVAALEAHIGKIRAYENALKCARLAGEIESAEFHKQVVPMLKELRDSASELHLLGGLRRTLEAGMQEDVNYSSCASLSQIPTATKLEHIKREYEHDRFRKAVFKYYGAFDPELTDVVWSLSWGSYPFGDKELWTYDPGNGLTMLSPIGEL